MPRPLKKGIPSSLVAARTSPPATGNRSRANKARRLSFERLEGRVLLDAKPLVISEFMAENLHTLKDAFGSYSDWIEIYNPNDSAVSLAGWSLTDDRNALTKWQFPDVSIARDGYLVVFASGRDRRLANAELHTNFQLDPDGEYLALVKPDGSTIEHEFAPAYPRQYEDISYGVAQLSVPLAGQGHALRYHVPLSADGAQAASWMEAGFDDSHWRSFARSEAVLVTEAGTATLDYVEIQNLAGKAVSTSGWVVAVNDGQSGDINAAMPIVWSLPNSMAADQVLYRGDDSSDTAHYWGGDIPWLTSGKGWVMIVDNHGQVADFVVWGYNVADIASLSVSINGWHVTAIDAWRGAAVTPAGRPSNSLQRRGYVDKNIASDWAFVAPQSRGTKNADLVSPFPADTGLGLGFDGDPQGIGDDVELDVGAAMKGNNASLWTRMPFWLADPSMLGQLQLWIKYNDGFVAYLNGHEVARRNAPESLSWDSSATEARSVEQSLQSEGIDISHAMGELHAGMNVLAIQGLNLAADDGNFLLSPEIILSGPQYFAPATPKKENGAGVEPLGPILSDLTKNPPPPTDHDALVITVQTRTLASLVDQVTLHYRVMYANETSVPMVDDGTAPDAVAGDGVYSALIPASAAGPGEMIRWRVTAIDTAGHNSRYPAFLDPKDSPEYLGTMVTDPSVVSSLPVLYWFVQNPAGANTASGTRSSLFFAGEFYDNVRTDAHGQSTSGFTKKPYDVDTNRGERFEYAEGQLRVKDFNLLSNWGDKAKVRNTMAYEIFAAAGVPGHVAFPVRVQQNGEFFSVADWVEDGDDRFLERLELDPEGALYKMYDTLSSTSAGEKKTRKWEDKSDLQALINGTYLSGDAAKRFLFDNINLAEAVNFLAAISIMDTTDMGHKNYYLYRDTSGTLEWQVLPWDVDLCLGHNWTSAFNYFDDTMYTNNPLFIGNGNRLFSMLYNTPSIREMYLRRLRTLMDEQLQPPGTPLEQRKLERRLDELVQQIDPHSDANPAQGSDDADLDYQQWGSWGDRGTMRQAVERIRSEYLPARRNFLYNTQTASHGGPIPEAQPDLSSLPPEQRRIVFGAVEFAPASGNQDEEYVEILNQNAFAVDISGWQLTDGVELTFQPGTVIPAQSRLYVAADLRAFRARASGPSGNQGLFVQGGFQGHLSSFGETVRLLDANGAPITAITYPGDPSLAQQFLRITEVMYNPPEPTDAELAAGFADNNQFEYIELINTATEPLNLDRVQFTRGIAFAFPNQVLGPQQRIVVVANQAAFQLRYGIGPRIAGQFASGRLDNNGEKIKLEDAQNGTIAEFSYNDSGPWPGRADGKGSSLEIIDPMADGDDPGNWRASTEYGGSPASAGTPAMQSVVINEVLSHTGATLKDAIELYNTTGEAIEVGGWYLSDSSSKYQKFQIPTGTIMAPHGYLTFDEDQFNPDPAHPRPEHFSLNGAHGDDVWLLSADAGGKLKYFVDHVEFGAARFGESIGRWPNGTGELYPMSSVTLSPPDQENRGPRVGPVVISEVQYRPKAPSADEFEYVEIYNPTSMAVDLTHWRLAGAIAFDFPSGLILAARTAMVVVPFAATDSTAAQAFRSFYHIEATAQLAGPYAGKLSDTGARVQLQRPDVPPLDEPSFIPRLLEDEVRYSATWDPNGGDSGDSLNRRSASLWGNDASSWAATTPTPGTVPFAAHAEVAGRYIFYNRSSFDGWNVDANADDDGAIATDKTALRPGEKAGIANYTSYSRGINGIMIDIAGLPSESLVASDFVFRAGTSSDLSTWLAAPDPLTVVVRPDAGIGGADRVSLVWPDDTMANRWLQVTVLANDHTGLAAPDVFYFGNAIGEVGNSPTSAQVDAIDLLMTRNNQRNFLRPALINSLYDFNRDGRVNAADMLIARASAADPSSALPLLVAPSTKSAKARSAKIAGNGATFSALH